MTLPAVVTPSGGVDPGATRAPTRILVRPKSASILGPAALSDARSAAGDDGAAPGVIDDPELAEALDASALVGLEVPGAADGSDDTSDDGVVGWEVVAWEAVVGEADGDSSEDGEAEACVVATVEDGAGLGVSA